jgi:hypothetical protein
MTQYQMIPSSMAIRLGGRVDLTRQCFSRMIADIGYLSRLHIRHLLRAPAPTLC